MSMIKCRECGKEISDQAVACPNCGAPLLGNPEKARQFSDKVQNIENRRKKKSRGCLITIIIIAIIVTGISVVITKVMEEPKKYGIKTVSNDKPMDKEDAGKLDEEVWKMVSNTIDMNNGLIDAIMGYSDSTVSELDLYDYSKDISSNLALSSYPKSNNEDAKAYIGSCEDFNLVVQRLSDSVKKYIDSKETGDLSTVKKNIESVNEAITIVSGNRGLFLKNAGFSQEEIQKIAEKTVN